MDALMHARPEAGAFELLDVPEPGDPGAGEAIVAVDACGICGSDLTLFRTGVLQVGVDYPRPLGHEFAGQILAVEADGRLQPGQWVLVNPHVRDPDCTCPPCRRRQTELCAIRPIHGVDLPGGFTRLISTRVANLVPVDRHVATRVGSLAEPLACGVHAMDRADVDASELVVVLGAGPIGILSAVAAQHRGVDRLILAGIAADEARLALARTLGLETLRSDTGELERRVAELSDGEGADVVVEAAGAQAALATAAKLVRPGGRILLDGIQHEPLVFADPADMVLNQKSVITTRAHQPSSWLVAREILSARTEELEPIITARVPLGDWREAISILDRHEALKIALVPA